MIECSICLDTLRCNMKQLECGHTFHKVCIDMWFSRNATCPLCRNRTIVQVVTSPRLSYHTVETTTQSIRFKIIAGTICFLIFLAAIIPLYMITH